MSGVHDFGMRSIFMSPAAKSDIRRIDQKQALKILYSIASLAKSGEGDVKPMQGTDPLLHRLRVVDYRVVFQFDGANLLIKAVGHRSEIYRRN